jgi:3-hydroxybutyryl-CoA dehydrogenase
VSIINKIGVIGAGVMGQGIAQNLATSNFEVILLDISDEILDQSRQNMLSNMRFQGLIDSNKKIQNPKEVLSRVHFTTDYGFLAEVDYVVENVSEKLEIKTEVYKKNR